jgi:8-oxo-dGTP pyrophosphatase MutT (NUDIX family)
MQDDRGPLPGEVLNPGPPTLPRPAATVILLRSGANALEVLLVQRSPSARFIGGAWVFPGGSVDPAEGAGDDALRAAARRELAEEAGIEIAGDDLLVPFARWITPARVKRRFDTWFFLALAPPGAQAKADGSEIVDVRWVGPAQALAAHARGELFLVFPTIKQLQQLARFSDADTLLAYARTQEVRPIQPRVVLSGETARIVLPGEPDYDR